MWAFAPAIQKSTTYPGKHNSVLLSVVRSPCCGCRQLFLYCLVYPCILFDQVDSLQNNVLTFYLLSIISEAGASIYSVSPEANKEMPGLDPNLRSAVSIARRVQDPLAELVKFDPKHIGVGMYQVKQCGLFNFETHQHKEYA